jgi:hypothetical protein
VSGSFCRVNLSGFAIDCTLYFSCSVSYSSLYRFIHTVTIDTRHTLFTEPHNSKARHISKYVHIKVSRSAAVRGPEHAASRPTVPGSVPGSKEVGCEGSRPPSTSVYVIHTRSYASTSPYLFMACCLIHRWYNLPSCLPIYKKCCGGNSNRPRPSPSTSFLIRHALIILPSDTAYPELLTVLLSSEQ